MISIVDHVFSYENLVHLRVDEGDVYLGCDQIYIVLHNNTKRAGAHHSGVLPVLFLVCKGIRTCSMGAFVNSLATV